MTANESTSAQDFIGKLAEPDLRAYSETARKLAFRFGLERTEADDIFQEALLRLLARNPVIDSEANFRAYLSMVIRSIAFDALRRQRMEAKHGRTNIPPEAIEQIPAEDTRGDHEDISRLLAALTERERDVATLTLRGFNAVEISKMLAIDASTVRSFLRRIRARFALIAAQER